MVLLAIAGAIIALIFLLLFNVQGFTLLYNLVKTTQATAQVPQSATTASNVFAGANGAKNPVSAAAMVAFINANGGMANVALQLLPNALTNGVLFGGGRLWVAMQPNKANVIGKRGLILWACVNGLPAGVTAATYAQKGLFKVPTKLKPIPLNQINTVHQWYGSGVNQNTLVPAGGQTNQNAVCAILNGAFGLSNQTLATYGNAYGQLVPIG